MTRARRGGDLAAIAAAEARVRQAYAEFDRGSDAFIDEMTALNQVRLDNLTSLLDQVGRGCSGPRDTCAPGRQGGGVTPVMADLDPEAEASTIYEPQGDTRCYVKIGKEQAA